jgi:hypothetical protein
VQFGTGGGARSRVDSADELLVNDARTEVVFVEYVD